MIVILYAAKTKLTGSHQMVRCGRVGVLYIRTEVSDVQDVLLALDQARPMEGEMVLNTTEFYPFPLNESVIV
jgi:hypothetical protein